MAEPLTIGQCDSCDTRIVLMARRCPGCKVGYIDTEADIQAALATIAADREKLNAALERLRGPGRFHQYNRYSIHLSDCSGCELLHVLEGKRSPTDRKAT